MRDLDAARLERQRQIDHLADALDVGAMHHEIDGQRQAEPHRLGGERVLALERAAIAGDVVGRRRVASWIETCTWSRPASQQIAHGARGDADARGDQVGVEPGLARMRGDLDQVAPRAGLAAGQMHLQHAERRPPRANTRAQVAVSSSSSRCSSASGLEQ